MAGKWNWRERSPLTTHRRQSRHHPSLRGSERAAERRARIMVGLPYDCLANPLGAVRSTFDKAIASGSDPVAFGGKDWGALERFRQFLDEQNGLARIPILNSSNISWVQPNTLVRFRGMIQDMLGNEFYVGAYKDGSVWRTNKFMDVSQFPMGSAAEMRIWERRLLSCVPVPGQNSWTESQPSTMNQCMELNPLNGEKRCRMDEALTDDLPSSPVAKKMKGDEQPSTSLQCGEFLTGANCMGTTVPSNIERCSLTCLVKVYDTAESEIKLNDVFEFIGVFSDSEYKVGGDVNDELFNGFSEELSVQVPHIKVPHLHCIMHRKLGIPDFLHNHPIIQPTPHLVKEIREVLLKHLTTILGNDEIAAHFLLLHLLSKVHTRADNVAVGKLSVNLTGLNKESMSIFGTQLNTAIKNLLPITHHVQLSVEYLNTALLAPRKDYETDRLIPGMLQLPEGSHLLIDETQLEAGILNPVGVENARMLKILMESQKVEYDFKYYKMEMAADVQLLILSEGKSNILPADLIVPFRPSLNSCEVATTKVLEEWRWYLSTARSLPHSIDLEMQQVVENDLVMARQADRSLGSQEFSRLLTMGRLMSASLGETCLTLEHWQMVKELERLRMERLK